MNKKWLKLKFKQERTFIVFIIVSLLIHISSYFNLKSYVKYIMDNDSSFKEALKVKYDDDEIKKKLVDEAKRLVEVEQEKNKRPDKYKHLGVNDHSTENETRADTRFNKPGADATLQSQEKQNKNIVKNKNNKNEDQNFMDHDRNFEDSSKKLSSVYKQYMPNFNYNDIDETYDIAQRSNKDSHADDLDDSIKEGKYTDVNTIQYKNIGYFIGMRKALEQVWVYPYEAKINRYQGEVGIIFKLEKDGSISDKRVMKSSGYKILDIYAMKALEEARFSPPPKDVYEKSPFYWTFTYQIY